MKNAVFQEKCPFFEEKNALYQESDPFQEKCPFWGTSFALISYFHP